MTKKEIEKRTKEAKEIIEMTQVEEGIDMIPNLDLVDIDEVEKELKNLLCENMDIIKKNNKLLNKEKEQWK